MSTAAHRPTCETLVRHVVTTPIISLLMTALMMMIVVSKFAAAHLAITLVVILERLASLREFHFDLPIVERTLTVHLLNRLQCVFLPREPNISEAPRVASLVILDHIDRLDGAVRAEHFAQSVLVGASGDAGDVNVAVVLIVRVW